MRRFKHNSNDNDVSKNTPLKYVKTKISGNRVKINCAVLEHKTTKCVLLVIDLATKNCEISAIGGGTHPSLLLEQSGLDVYEITMVEFVEYGEEWDVFSANVSGSAVYVTLYKNS